MNVGAPQALWFVMKWEGISLGLSYLLIASARWLGTCVNGTLPMEEFLTELHISIFGCWLEG